MGRLQICQSVSLFWQLRRWKMEKKCWCFIAALGTASRSLPSGFTDLTFEEPWKVFAFRLILFSWRLSSGSPSGPGGPRRSNGTGFWGELSYDSVTAKLFLLLVQAIRSCDSSRHIPQRWRQTGHQHHRCVVPTPRSKRFSVIEIFRMDPLIGDRFLKLGGRESFVALSCSLLQAQVAFGAKCGSPAFSSALLGVLTTLL